MQATEILKTEHRVIEQVLNCLEHMAERCVARGTLDIAAAEQALDFFQNFADRCHHGKEEGQLFPLLEARGIPREHGPIGRMLHEHVVGRQHVQAMRAALRDAAARVPDSLRCFVVNARAYVYVLREHIRKEDDRLFPLTDRVLSGQDQQALCEAFAHVESADMGTGTHEKYLRIADELADRFDVPRAFPPAAGVRPRCSCGHHAVR
jgi:hemerythrin-like domain-containing protein